jgi:hypothetical protein
MRLGDFVEISIGFNIYIDNDWGRVARSEDMVGGVEPRWGCLRSRDLGIRVNFLGCSQGER